MVTWYSGPWYVWRRLLSSGRCGPCWPVFHFHLGSLKVHVLVITHYQPCPVSLSRHLVSLPLRVRKSAWRCLCVGRVVRHWILRWELESLGDVSDALRVCLCLDVEKSSFASFASNSIILRAKLVAGYTGVSLVALGTFTGLACYRYNSRSQAPVMDFQDGQFDAVFWRQSPDWLLSTALQVAVVLRRTCCYPRSSLDPETSSAFYAQNPVSVRVECILPGRSWTSLRRSRFRFGT